MNTTSNKTYLLLIFNLTLQLIASAQISCELRKDKDNIKIFSCKTKESAFNAIKAEFEVNATLRKYISVALDVDHYKDWHYKEVNQKIIKRVSDTEFIYYSQVTAPFPVSNRDLILHLKLEQDSITKVLTVSITSMAHYLPLVENCVRVPQSISKMTITPLEESKLRINYLIQVDPGGQIPAWVANTFSTQAPYETFKKLIERLEEK